MDSVTVIRASSLPQYPDCPRRHAARSFGEDVTRAGFELRRIPPSIGAAIGTGTHAALTHVMQKRIDGQDIDAAAMDAIAVEAIDKEISDGVVWDDTTTSAGAAHRQAIRQAKAILQCFGEEILPVAVEESMQAEMGDGFVLRGHVDVREAGRILDFKTGTVQRANQAQYGGYSLLARANGHDVTRLAEIYVKRVGPTKPQPDATMTEYAQAECERAAWTIAQSIKRGLAAFRETGDAWEFLPNPNSMMCSPDYCPAWGTEFCKAHKEKDVKA